MKRYIRKAALFVAVYFILDNIFPMSTMKAAAFSDITIDGYYDDWADKPYSWEMNWNNPYIIGRTVYTDENGNPYNIEIRHKMALYCDGVNVFLHIQMCSSYSGSFSGDDYEFYVDGHKTIFRVMYPGSNNNTKLDRGNGYGIYPLEVRHGDSALSGTVAAGCEAVLTRYRKDLNDELELKIPLTTLKAQNSNINIESFSLLEFFTPNLMYRRISCSGASTGPWVGVAVCTVFTGGVIFFKKKKNRGNNG